ncbi:unnamed protein product [Thelazia callipaeda]|uniref:CYSTM domain-containing protein n=1 Tax=Thelazia callipaeda TaxID=103827 RepID=A0A0N5CSM1_THECL|nr:unnamed protein product [Thelazia callipaeda]
MVSALERPFNDQYGPYPGGQCHPCPPPPGYYYPQPCQYERRRYSGCPTWLISLFAFCCGCFIGDYCDTDCCCCCIPCPRC